MQAKLGSVRARGRGRDPGPEAFGGAEPFPTAAAASRTLEAPDMAVLPCAAPGPAHRAGTLPASPDPSAAPWPALGCVGKPVVLGAFTIPVAKPFPQGPSLAPCLRWQRHPRRSQPLTEMPPISFTESLRNLMQMNNISLACTHFLSTCV